MGGDFASVMRAAVEALAPRTQWPSTRMFVPHAGAARALRQALRGAGPGLLPEIINLEAPEPVAAALGVPIPAPSNPWPLRVRLLQILKNAESAFDDAVLVRQTEPLMQSLNLLAEHGIKPQQLRTSVPQGLAEIWAVQGSVLLDAWGWAQPQAVQWLPAARQRALWQSIMHALVQRGRTGPLLWLPGVMQAPHTDALRQALEPLGLQSVDPAFVPVEPLTLVADNPIDELQRITLLVVQALQQRQGPVGVVASGNFAEQLATELAARFGIKATQTGGLRWKETAAGQQLFAQAQAWLQRDKALSMAYWLQPHLNNLPEALQLVLQPLLQMGGLWPAATALAWLELALTALAPQQDEVGQRDLRVQLLPPHAAAWQNFGTLIVPQLVEGVWPARGQQGVLGEAQRRALGLPERSTQAQQAAAVLRRLQTQGVPQVVFTRSRHTSAGSPQNPSRWWPVQAEGVLETYSYTQLVKAQPPSQLGVLRPTRLPQTLSPSLVEQLLACPYKAYLGRVLKLEALPPLMPEPDRRMIGNVLHAWLEQSAKRYPHVSVERVAEVTLFLRGLIPALIQPCEPMLQRLLETRMHALAPEVARLWAVQGRTLHTEQWLSAEVSGAMPLRAKADAFVPHEVVLDYKTGTPPEAAEVKDGRKPQLLLEAWLLAQRGEVPKTMEYWQLRGYGTEKIKIHAQAVEEALLAQVEPSLQRVVEAYFTPGAAWPAVPDAAGAGVLAEGACKTCEFAGVCRRRAVALGGSA